MRIIFCDFDGVLNSAMSFKKEINLNNKGRTPKVRVNETLCVNCTKNLQKILDAHPDVQIVISSTWRTLYSLDWLKDKLNSYGIDGSRVIGKTPGYDIQPRGVEISQWLENWPEVTDYVILDDNRIGNMEKHEGHFFQTNWETGLTTHIAKKVIKYFDRNKI